MTTAIDTNTLMLMMMMGNGRGMGSNPLLMLMLLDPNFLSNFQSSNSTAVSTTTGGLDPKGMLLGSVMGRSMGGLGGYLLGGISGMIGAMMSPRPRRRFYRRPRTVYINRYSRRR